jgi:hypothetical protein
LLGYDRWPMALVGVKVVAPRTKDFLDSIVFSRGHDLSHGTDAALSRVVGAADHAGVSSRSSHPLARVWTSQPLRRKGN